MVETVCSPSLRFTSVRIDRRLFKSYMRYSGDGGGGGGGKEGLKREIIVEPYAQTNAGVLPEGSHMLGPSEEEEEEGCDVERQGNVSLTDNAYRVVA